MQFYFYVSDDLPAFYNKLQQDLSLLNDWFIANKLTLNVDKTKYMIFHRPLKDVASQGTLVINGVSLERELRIKFLGVILDECLNWRDQIQYVTDKISTYVGIFYNVRSSVTVTSLILLYNSLVYSHLTYCNSVWCLASRKYLDPLHKTQKKLVRAMSHSHYLAHSAPLMKTTFYFKYLRCEFLSHLFTCF